MDTTKIALQLRDFAREREWEKFHTPKNLASALVVEAGELLENFQWMTDTEAASVAQDPVIFDRVTQELADVLIYAIRLADVLNVDLTSAVESKIEKNAMKYPIEKARGSATKYTDLR